MILEDLYSINDLQIRENIVVEAKIGLNLQHDVFSGHFPGHPVVPGVCLTHMITDTISLAYGRPYFLVAADFLKFIHLVIPSEHNLLSVRVKILSSEGEVITAEAQIFSENTIFLKFKGSFKIL